MAKDDRWPEKCTLQGCTNPHSAGHHHHFVYGHLNTQVCYCEHVDQPGTRPWQNQRR